MTKDGHAVALLSGELTVDQRASVIGRFRRGIEKVLITTNVSARGMYRLVFCWFPLMLKGHSGAELHIYFLVHLESIYYEIFFYSKIVPNCAVAK